MFRKKYSFFELKSLDTKGSFAGYGSVYDVLDLKGDVMKPGVFAKSLAKWADKGRLPPVLWQHQSFSPIGKYTTMSEDGKGLYTEGQLLIKSVQQAQEAYALLDAGAINGQSVGYNTVDEEYNPKAGVFDVKEADLWECSIVTFPANTEALISEVKSALMHGELPSVKQFESFLRESGFSRTRAAAIASSGYTKLYQSESDDGTGESPVNGVLDLIATKSFDFKPNL